MKSTRGGYVVIQAWYAHLTPEADMTEEPKGGQRRGRAVTAAAILDAAEELFYARGYAAVTVRDVARHAGVSHALVHQYLGDKSEIFRAVIVRNESYMVAAASGNSDLLESASLILRQGLSQHGRAHVRLLVGSALAGVPYDGQFAAIDRLVELAQRQAETASQTERAEKELDPRLVVACVGSLLLGWVAGESWMRPAAGLEDLGDAELSDGLERVILGILRDHVPGAGGHAVATVEIGELRAQLAAIRDEMAAIRELLTAEKRTG